SSRRCTRGAFTPPAASFSPSAASGSPRGYRPAPWSSTRRDRPGHRSSTRPAPVRWRPPTAAAGCSASSSTPSWASGWGCARRCGWTRSTSPAIAAPWRCGRGRRCRCHGGRYGWGCAWSIERSSLRQGHELLLVAGDLGEAALLPVALRLIDAVLAARDEVPPEVALAVERRSAEQHDPRGAVAVQQGA